VCRTRTGSITTDRERAARAAAHVLPADHRTCTGDDMTSPSDRPDGDTPDSAVLVGDPERAGGGVAERPQGHEGLEHAAGDADEGLHTPDDSDHGGRGVVVAGHPDPRLTGEEPVGRRTTLALLLYSDDVDTRAAVRLAIGRRVSADLPEVEWTECATAPALIAAVDRGGHDVLILDGEAAPAGGLGLCKQLKDEIFRCPPILVLTGRPQDAWLATWSRADAAVPHPLDPGALAEAVAGLARRRVAAR
jgi:CheY-like chemotaxis protein